MNICYPGRGYFNLAFYICAGEVEFICYSEIPGEGHCVAERKIWVFFYPGGRTGRELFAFVLKFATRGRGYLFISEG